MLNIDPPPSIVRASLRILLVLRVPLYIWLSHSPVRNHRKIFNIPVMKTNLTDRGQCAISKSVLQKARRTETSGVKAGTRRNARKSPGRTGKKSLGMS